MLELERPKWRSGKKGIERRIAYGLKGPKIETLVTRVRRKMSKAVRRARGKHSALGGQEYVLRRRFRNDQTITLARVMDALGLDPKDPKDKKVRAVMQRFGQKAADLRYETVFDSEGRRDPQKHHELTQIYVKMGQTIQAARGDEAVESFNAIWRDKQSDIQIAHEEAGRRDRKRLGE